MKKNTLLKLAGALLVLTLITTTLVSGTYAKYVTTVTGTGTATVAKWKVNFDASGAITAPVADTTTFNILDTLVDTGVSGKLLAPGTTGSFTMTYDTDSSQVARNVTIKLDANALLTALPYVEFSIGGTKLTPASGILELVNKDFAAGAADTGTVTVTWAWPFYKDATQDAADTTVGIAASTYNLAATFTATQLDN